MLEFCDPPPKKKGGGILWPAQIPAGLAIWVGVKKDPTLRLTQVFSAAIVRLMGLCWHDMLILSRFGRWVVMKLLHCQIVEIWQMNLGFVMES